MPCSIASARSAACGASVTMSSLISSVTAEHLVDADPVVEAGLPAEVAAHAARRSRRCRPTRRRARRTRAPRAWACTARCSARRSRRISRCPTTPSSDDAIRNGSMPMSMNRCSADVASVACSDDIDEVTGERGLHRDARGLDVTDLADEDRVGVLAEDRTQPGGERHARRLVDLDLVDRREDVLDRVLDRHDVDVVVVDLGERRVQRGRLPGAGRARADHHAVRRADEVGSTSRRSRATCRAAASSSNGPRLVEDPHHALLAEHGRASSTRGRRARGRRP